tara:strand:+ start:20221 stop:20997 length:777 start_codon:yes stop_codon:yes gene_type:complete
MEIQKINQEKKSVISSLASKYEMEPAAFQAVIKETVMPGNVKNEEMASFLLVAKEYDLNPLTKEIYAFSGRGKVTPIVSVDGWAKIINNHPQLDGIEFVDNNNDSDLISVECKIYRKDRKMPVCATEYMAECKGSSEPWKKWPRRMLRHKALIQAARYAFSFSGIYDVDEAERIKDVTPLTPVHNPEKVALVSEAIEHIEQAPSVVGSLKIRINNSSSIDELESIGDEIKSYELNKIDREEISICYKEKINQFKNHEQ